MSLLLRYQNLGLQLIDSFETPAIAEILLPPEQATTQKLDQFGFVVLQDNSAAPFYCTLEDSYQKMRKISAEGFASSLSLQQALEGFVEDSIARRALALGVFNALSHSLFRQAGFNPCDLKTEFNRKTGPELVGMVGFFRPLITRLVEQGNQVLIVEKNPDRVKLQPGVKLASDPSELWQCDRILCTASTLINDSLEEVLAQRREGVAFTLIGPSGSGLPDILFDLGVDEVGGFAVNDLPALRQQVRSGDSWGKAGQKYSITALHYPGIDFLLKQANGSN